MSGVLMAFLLVAAMFFSKFWQKTRDRLFIIFGAGFLLMAIERFVLIVSTYPKEDQAPIYFMRLAAFAIIIFGILDRNRRD
jgi:hypothetical protein